MTDTKEAVSGETAEDDGTVREARASVEQLMHPGLDTVVDVALDDLDAAIRASERARIARWLRARAYRSNGTPSYDTVADEIEKGAGQ